MFLLQSINMVHELLQENTQEGPIPFWRDWPLSTIICRVPLMCHTPFCCHSWISQPFLDQENLPGWVTSNVVLPSSSCKSNAIHIVNSRSNPLWYWTELLSLRFETYKRWHKFLSNIVCYCLNTVVLEDNSVLQHRIPCYQQTNKQGRTEGKIVRANLGTIHLMLHKKYNIF